MENWEKALKKFGMLETDENVDAGFPFTIHDFTEVVMHQSNYKMETLKSKYVIDVRSAKNCKYDRKEFDRYQAYRAKEQIFRHIEDLIRINVIEDERHVTYEAEFDVAIPS